MERRKNGKRPSGKAELLHNAVAWRVNSGERSKGNGEIMIKKSTQFERKDEVVKVL